MPPLQPDFSKGLAEFSPGQNFSRGNPASKHSWCTTASTTDQRHLSTPLPPRLDTAPRPCSLASSHRPSIPSPKKPRAVVPQGLYSHSSQPRRSFPLPYVLLHVAGCSHLRTPSLPLFPDRFHCLSRAVSAGCDALVRFRTGPRLRHPRLPGAYCLGEVSSSIPMQEADSNPEKETAWDAGLQPRLLALLFHWNCQTATSKIATVRIMVVVRGS